MKVDGTGSIDVYNSLGSTAVTVTAMGYFTDSTSNASGGFVPTNLDRVANTATGDGVPLGKLGVGQSVDIQVAGEGDISNSARSVFANIEVRNATSSGKIRVGEGGADLSAVPAAMSYGDSGAYVSCTTLQLNSSGVARVMNASGSPIDIKIDVEGYVSSDPEEGSSYNPLTSSPLYSTTDTGQTSLGAGETREIPVLGKAGIPDSSNVGALATSLAVRGWGGNGTVTAFNPDEGNPGSAIASFTKDEGDPANGLVVTAITGISDDGTIALHNTSSAPVTVSLATQGWFTLPPVEYSDDPDPIASEFPDYTPTPALIQSGSSSATFSPSLPNGYTITDDPDVASGNAAAVLDASGTRVGAFTPIVVDESGATIPYSIGSTGNDLTVSVETPSAPQYPVAVMAVYVDDGDPEASARVDDLTAAMTSSPPRGDAAAAPSVDAGEVDSNGYVIPPESAPDSLSAAGPISGDRPNKVSVPHGYRYHPQRGPHVALHDYCTKSPDTFDGTTFRGPCAIHDMCYDRIRKNNEPWTHHYACDLSLWHDMRTNCAYAHPGLLGTTRRFSCYGVANVYEEVVIAHTTIEGV
ncbi:phospholipase A2 [Nocardioides terrisoli]|uniref:phospholipase A2 n=1 Tax=Nocardioides terrisoli TaxID=3388267 RepID=UPI00287B9642|nr:phospholipase A2 [Nocardioides marmorisolisilvae]